MNYCKFLYCFSTFLTNYSILIDFVAYRHRTVPLDNVLLFPTKKFPTEGIENVLQQRLLIPQVIVKNETSPHFGNFVNSNSIAIIFVARVVEQITLWQFAMTLCQHPFIPIVCVSRKIPNDEDMREFFQFFTRMNMINLVLIYRQNDTVMVRTYSSFPRLRIISLDAKNFSSFYWIRNENVHGYNFKVSVYYDPPMAYLLDNRTELYGVIGQMIQLFLSSVNGTFSVVTYPMDEKTKNSVDINANLILRAGVVQSRAEPSYPLFRTQVCLVLPVESGIPLRCYLHNAFDQITWILLGLTFISLIAIICFIAYRFSKHRHDHGLYALFAIKMLLNQPITAYLEMATQINILVGYFGVLFIVLETLYAGSLTSMLSAKVLMPEVRTVEDFLKTNLRIMSFPEDRELYFDSGLLPSALIPRLYPVDHKTMTKHLHEANTSFAYLMTHEKWVWYEKAQKHLQQPYFRVAKSHRSDFCTTPLHQILSIRKQSPFKRSLNILTMRLQQYGFIKHWLEEATPSNILRMPNGTRHYNEPMKLEHFTHGLYILGFGWSLAFIVFLGEFIAWKRREIVAKLRFLRIWKILRSK